MYFHNGDSIKTNTFHNNECIQEFVHVSGLSNDHYLFNENPYLLVMSDGIILGLDQRTPSLDLFDEDHNHLETIIFSFITTCDSPTIKESEVALNHPTLHTGIFFIVIALALFVFIMIFKKKGNYHEN